jgi:hypothetical protein
MSIELSSLPPPSAQLQQMIKDAMSPRPVTTPASVPGDCSLTTRSHSPWHHKRHTRAHCIYSRLLPSDQIQPPLRRKSNTNRRDLISTSKDVPICIFFFSIYPFLYMYLHTAHHRSPSHSSQFCHAVRRDSQERRSLRALLPRWYVSRTATSTSLSFCSSACAVRNALRQVPGHRQHGHERKVAGRREDGDLSAEQDRACAMLPLPFPLPLLHKRSGRGRKSGAAGPSHVL